MSGNTGNMVSNLTPNIPQSTLVLYKGQENFRPSNIPPNSQNSQVDAEAYTVDVYSFSLSTTETIDRGVGAGSPNTEILITDIRDGLPATMSLGFIPSPARESEGSFPGSFISYENQRDINLSDGNKSRICHQECMPMNTFSDHSHPYTHVRTIPDSSVPSTLPPDIYRTPTIAQYQEQRTSGEMSQHSKKSGKAPATVPQRPLSQPNDKHGTPQGRYWCRICGRDFAQPQGVTRHHRDTHEAGLCIYCGVFKSGRPYRLREHIKKKHPGLLSDVALEEAAKTRYGVTNNTKYSPQPCALPSTSEHTRLDCAETQRLCLSSPPGAMVNVAPGSPPSMSMPSASNNPPAASAESILKRRKLEDARALFELPYDTHGHHITFPPVREHAQVEKADPSMSARIQDMESVSPPRGPTTPSAYLTRYRH